MTMRRKTFDALLTSFGLVLAAILLASGALLTWASSFVGDQVNTQLSQQQIFFPPKGPTTASPEIGPFLNQYAGQQLLTGQQAEAYADHFIAVHLKEAGGGLTYAPLSTKAQAAPTTPSWRGRSRQCSRVRPCAVCCSTPTPSAPWVGSPASPGSAHSSAPRSCSCSRCWASPTCGGSHRMPSWVRPAHPLRPNQSLWGLGRRPSPAGWPVKACALLPVWPRPADPKTNPSTNQDFVAVSSRARVAAWSVSPTPSIQSVGAEAVFETGAIPSADPMIVHWPNGTEAKVEDRQSVHGARNSVAGARARFRCPVCQLEPPPVPWPSPVDLGFQREAQHDPDQHDHPQYPDALERRVDDDRSNDVGDYQHFEAEQDHPSKVRAQLSVGHRCVRDNLLRIAGESEEPADDHDCCSNALDDLHDLADEILVAHPPNGSDGPHRCDRPWVGAQ